MTKKKAPKDLKPRGPKTKFDKQTPITAGWLARDGKTNDEIAAALGITRSTLQEWIKQYPELSDALKNNKSVADNKVEDALFKRAIGYDLKKTEVEVQKVGNKEVKKMKESAVHIPADPTAIIFWLSNRRPETWKRNPQFMDFEKAKGEINELLDQMKKEAAST